MHAVSSAQLRRSQRILATIPISLLVERHDSNMKHDAYTVDLSHEGVRVRTTFVLVLGEMVGIVPCGDSGKAIPTRVVWVRRPGSGRGSLAGLEFLDILPA
jgi:hypothetical protein